ASSGVTEGVLVQMPITGNMDTICAPKQFVTALTRDYSVKDKIDSLAISMKDTMSYFPIDCIVSQASVSCDSCFTVKLLSADFQLDGTIHVGNTTNFIVKASSFTNTQNSQWIVSDVDLSTNLDMSPIITGAPLGPWGVASPSTTFGGYPTAETGIGNGFFVQGHKYRFRHILSQTNNCGQLFTDTVTKVIYMCTSCKNNKGGFIIIDESNGSQSNTFSSATFSNEKINLSKAEIYPNPANNTITINTEKLEVLNPVLQITTSTGQTIYSLKLNDIKHTLNVASWASGSYSYNIFAKGKIIDSGKFIVQH
ncbi:MAG: T9SS type A sorting domain-containing protein, partial [Chitinophagaceae bacterium]